MRGRACGIADSDTWIYGGEGADGRRTGCIAPPPLLESLYSVSLSNHLLGETCECSVHPAHGSHNQKISSDVEVEDTFIWLTIFEETQ
jgi:hypothetical protein